MAIVTILLNTDTKDINLTTNGASTITILDELDHIHNVLVQRIMSEAKQFMGNDDQDTVNKYITHLRNAKQN